MQKHYAAVEVRMLRFRHPIGLLACIKCRNCFRVEFREDLSIHG
jgi:hypothetical protein